MDANMPAAGLRVLLVEDEPMVAVLAEDLLDSIGCVVAATVGTVGAAREAIETLTFDVAMLDVNLDGEDGLVVAALLKARGTPYFLSTGYDRRGTATNEAPMPTLTKPYGISELEAIICRCVGR